MPPFAFREFIAEDTFRLLQKIQPVGRPGQSRFDFAVRTFKRALVAKSVNFCRHRYFPSRKRER
jgi:hypothetical protein